MQSSTLNRCLRGLIFALLCTIVFVLSAYIQLRADVYVLPGFWSGLSHGFLFLFSAVGSLITDLRIYASPNSGGSYDLGYLIGVALFLAGGAVAV